MSNVHVMNVNTKVFASRHLARHNVHGLLRDAAGDLPANCSGADRNNGHGRRGPSCDGGPMSEMDAAAFAPMARSRSSPASPLRPTSPTTCPTSTVEALTSAPPPRPIFRAHRAGLCSSAPRCRARGAGARKCAELQRRNTDKLRFGSSRSSPTARSRASPARLRWPGYHNGAPNGIWYIGAGRIAAGLSTPTTRAGLAAAHPHQWRRGDRARASTRSRRRWPRMPRRDHRHTLQHCQMADAGAVPPHGGARHVRQPVRQPHLLLGRPAL